MLRCEGLRVQAEAVESARSIAGDDDVSVCEQVVELCGPSGLSKVEYRAPLAEQRVGWPTFREIRTVRRVEPQHIRTESAQESGADGSSDHSREVEDPRRAATIGAGRAVPEELKTDERLGRRRQRPEGPRAIR